MSSAANDNARVICVTRQKDRRKSRQPYCITLPGGDQWCSGSLSDAIDLAPIIAGRVLRDRSPLTIKMLLENRP